MEIEAPAMDEADAIADCWMELAAGQRAFGSHVLPEPNRQAVRESVARHIVTGGVLVARPEDHEEGLEGSSGAFLGFVSFAPETDGYETDVDRGVVESIFVREAARGRGVGSALLSAAERRLFAEGADAVSLEVLADNEVAREFYRARGYEPHRIELEKPAPDQESDKDSRED